MNTAYQEFLKTKIKTDKERNLLCQILIEMRNDFDIVEGADFNEALKILTK